jgi:hypothetical protein
MPPSEFEMMSLRAKPTAKPVSRKPVTIAVTSTPSVPRAVTTPTAKIPSFAAGDRTKSASLGTLRAAPARRISP